MPDTATFCSIVMESLETRKTGMTSRAMSMAMLQTACPT